MNSGQRLMFFSVLLLFAFFICFVKRPDEGEFGYFVLALQWPGTICQGTRHCCPSNGCCKKYLAPTEFTIHGLWPNYNDGSWPACCSKSAFDIKKIASLMGMLEKYWPSLSCGSSSLCSHGKGSFWAHEWEKHGTCSYPVIRDEYTYFSTVLDLYFKYNITKVLVDAGFLPSNNNEYPLEGIIATIEEAFGASPLLVCKHGAVEELRLCLYKNFTPRDCLIDSNAPNGTLHSGSSHCPRYIRIPEYTRLMLGENNATVSEEREVDGEWQGRWPVLFDRNTRMDVAQYFLDGNADAVEFCPHYPSHHILAAATYTLQEGVQSNRSGSISLFSVGIDTGLKLLYHVETVGVFDIKWNPDGANIYPLLAQADADGYLRLHGLGCSPEVSEGVLKEVSGEKISSAMCLCLDWNPSSTSISVGLSDGSISVVTVREAKLQPTQAWKAHEFELWAASFDIHQPHLLYTGSDDCRLSCWDLRGSTPNPVFQNSKTHKMGVCCITKSPTNSNVLLTGSYDEFLRVWDVRSVSKPVNESSICLGGGVWRIKHHPELSGLVLAACMHNGFAVARAEGDRVEVLETYNKNESLAYGADWQRGFCTMKNGTQRGSLVATCSFYDRLLRIWLPESQMVNKILMY